MERLTGADYCSTPLIMFYEQFLRYYYNKLSKLAKISYNVAINKFYEMDHKNVFNRR